LPVLIFFMEEYDIDPNTTDIWHYWELNEKTITRDYIRSKSESDILQAVKNMPQRSASFPSVMNTSGVRFVRQNPKERDIEDSNHPKP
jgi:hypothetical protein